MIGTAKVEMIESQSWQLRLSQVPAIESSEETLVEVLVVHSKGSVKG